jgi:phytoene synthase
MEKLLISKLVGSSQHRAVADDALKDEDNAAWVMELEPSVQQEWIERISWIRLVDRLAENQLIDPANQEFQKFYQGWKQLLAAEPVLANTPYHAILADLHDRWMAPNPDQISLLSITSWERFLSATIRYHKSGLVIHSLKDYTTMLSDLSGSCFQLLPFLQPKYWHIADAFGRLDQFFNNLRDMREDAEQGICYFPTELLIQFGVSRSEILQLNANQNPNYTRMMRFWLDRYLPVLQAQIQPLLSAQDLHPSWRIWRDWSLCRYQRIERIFRECNFDYTRFPERYWAEVERNLPLLLAQIRQSQNLNSCTSPRQADQTGTPLSNVLLFLKDRLCHSSYRF